MSAALSFENVTLRYGDRRALDAVSYDFAPGRVTGLAGPNGAGKTTLLRTALSLLKPESGTIRLFDRPLGDWSDDARRARPSPICRNRPKPIGR